MALPAIPAVVIAEPAGKPGSHPWVCRALVTTFGNCHYSRVGRVRTVLTNYPATLDDRGASLTGAYTWIPILPTMFRKW